MRRALLPLFLVGLCGCLFDDSTKASDGGTGGAGGAGTSTGSGAGGDGGCPVGIPGQWSAFSSIDTLDTDQLAMGAYYGAGHIFVGAHAMYSIAGDYWSPLPFNLVQHRYQPSVAYTNEKLFVWGGFDMSYRSDGSVYDVGGGIWLPIDEGPLSPRYAPSVSTDDDGSVYVVSGYSDFGAATDGARFDVLSHSVTLLPALEAGRNQHRSAWISGKLMIWGGVGDSGYLRSGNIYDSESNEWKETSRVNAPLSRSGHLMLSTDSEVFLWGGTGRDGQALATGAMYHPPTDSWRYTNLYNAPPPEQQPTGVWDGQRVVVMTRDGTGASYDPKEDHWTPLEKAPVAPIGIFWDGCRLIAVGPGIDGHVYAVTYSYQ